MRDPGLWKRKAVSTSMRNCVRLGGRRQRAASGLKRTANGRLARWEGGYHGGMQGLSFAHLQRPVSARVVQYRSVARRRKREQRGAPMACQRDAQPECAPPSPPEPPSLEQVRVRGLSYSPPVADTLHSLGGVSDIARRAACCVSRTRATSVARLRSVCAHGARLRHTSQRPPPSSQCRSPTISQHLNSPI